MLIHHNNVVKDEGWMRMRKCEEGKKRREEAAPKAPLLSLLSMILEKEVKRRSTFRRTLASPSIPCFKELMSCSILSSTDSIHRFIAVVCTWEERGGANSIYAIDFFLYVFSPAVNV
jgi:hypothetical protein